MKSKHLPSASSAVLAALALAMAPAHAATVIYSDDFSGLSTTNLNGQAPDTRPGSETWTASNHVSASSPGWRANGSIAAESSGIVLRGAFLPFTPTTGKIYTLSLDINTTAGDWLAMGFTQGAGLTSDFYGATTNAGPWLLDLANGDTQTFRGPGLLSQVNVAGTNITHSYSIVLDTNPTLWTATWYRDSTLIRPATAFTTNPTINHIGIIKHDNAAGTVDNLSLTVIPEPSTALLGGLGLLALLRRRRA